MNLKLINDAIAALHLHIGAKLNATIGGGPILDEFCERMQALRSEVSKAEDAAGLASLGAALTKTTLLITDATVASLKAVLGARDAAIADLGAKLAASETECKRLQTEAAKCSAATADASRKLAAAERELDRLGVSGQCELICAIKTLHQAVLETRRGGDALNVSPGKRLATGGIIDPKPAAAPAAAQPAPVLGVYPHPPAGAKFGRWESVIGSPNPAWVESLPSNASGLPG